ncbi:MULTISPECIES: NAD(P)H-dependent oxidoreductase [Phyllobacteriaceae]|jgi:NAD(P)H dehydrogenase (quinone)|uniref:NAD(P)H dehydrogenase n=1 Tax=Mesorhizobium hungaricum TaxID=1566387 RepID=A0A1C2DNX2_9HYPH|nr:MULTISPECIES: NAD(P)H-dependent oxidoreductase [Mesorhizobium]MBN9233726.1 NAD(P)H-dependent oxidoreductase [Mesorhizobium sp.]MDQ0328467.1 putative NADPH-quinone reductase [Mesorhizobium sp. YL-MeA3-2017]OCX16363.1 NAD(P)H dehydrogenase [Mesorhizobium hungaricum]
MRVLVVYCHPVPESFCAAVRDAALEGIAGKGCEARLVDLYAENFDPVMRDGERRDYNERAPVDPALAAHIAHLNWAEAIVFIYPTWWYGLPAMLKGWLDRVWAKDVAFSLDAGGRITPLMGHVQKIAVVTTCGAPRWWSHVVGHPGRKTILRGIRALCAKRCKTLFLAHYLMDASTPESRAAFLGQVRQKLQAF